MGPNGIIRSPIILETTLLLILLDLPASDSDSLFWEKFGQICNPGKLWPSSLLISTLLTFITQLLF